MGQSSPQPRHRRALGKTSSQTNGNTGRRKLIGPDPGQAGYKPHPPPRLQRVQRKLGKRITALRKKKGLTSQQLAFGCGVTSMKMAKIEGGQVNLALSTMLHLSQQLGLGLDRLFRGIK